MSGALPQPARYAVYFAPPPDSALGRFGSAILGYDAESGADMVQRVPAGIDAERFRALTTHPRVYGFHATLKAPFRLAPQVSEATLLAAFASFAAKRRRFQLAPLALRAVGRQPGAGAFIALAEREPAPALAALERATVEAFEPFRAALTEAEYKKRRPDKLTGQQRAYLDRYGYPYVFEEFRFHMTLTNRVPEAEVESVVAGLATLYEEVVPSVPVVVDQLVLFKQEQAMRENGEPARFRVIARQDFEQVVAV
ncbi:DUF1045 domain-containing protein [Chelatococcus sp. GCM10030263]|uniref:DUF1045 domain-containing protein n=1 Tax=Chelatococcus sp. GCM10030263 TaxID=3273387 RepID=UPI00360FA65F